MNIYEELNKYGLENKIIKSTKYFPSRATSFSALNDASNYVKTLNFTQGSLCESEPVGLAKKDEYDSIAKWRNISKEDRDKLNGVLLSNDFRNGAVCAVIFEEKTEQNKIVEIIYDTLMSHEFETWYKTIFEDYVSGEECAKSREEILSDIQDIFYLNRLEDSNA